MYSLKSFAVCLLVVVSLVQQSSSFCQPFNETSGLAEYCGYSATVNFTHEKHFKTAVKSLRSVARFLSSCSDYAKVIACSVYAPRCEPHIDGPYLPCKRVCDEFNSKCSDRIQRYGLEWIIGMCQLLPKKDDPNTEGYRGRCFVPPGFKTNITKSIPLKCSPLVVPICQHVGYTTTVLSEQKQKTYISWASRKINSVSNRLKCSLSQKRFFCMENFPPCVNNTIGFYCRPKCIDFFKMNCTSPFRYSTDICMEFPDGSAKNDLCTQKHWPRADNWPQVRHSRKPSTPVVGSAIAPKTVSPVGSTIAPKTVSPDDSSETVTKSTAPTTTPGDAPNRIAAIQGKHAATNVGVAPIVGGVLAGISVLALGLLIAFKIYRNKKRESSFPYDKQILYNEENVEMS